MYTNSRNTVSKVIRFLRFPLTVLVVMIHGNIDTVSMGGIDYVYNYADYPVYNNIVYFFSKTICRIAVPMFFLFSGYLFFRDSHFTIRDYSRKLRRRAFSLFIPYMFWNMEVICMFFLLQTFIPGMASGANKLIVDYQFKDWVEAFWNVHADMPMCSQFWFIRDLMVVVICSPLVYFLISRLHYFYISVLGLIWILGITPGIAGISTESFFFFSLGGFISLKGIDASAVLRKNWSLLYPLVVLFLLFRMVMYNLEQTGMLVAPPKTIVSIIANAGLLLLMGAALCVTQNGTENRGWKIREILNDSNFFIYAFHEIPLAFLIKMVVKYINPASDALLIVTYFSLPIIVIAMGVSLFAVLRRFLPRFTSIITGNRV